MPPGKNIDGFMPMLVSGMNRFNFWFHVSKEGCKRFFDDFLPRLHQEKQDVLKADDNNSWYLVYIGTKPESRGKGYAGDLIAHTAKKVCIEPNQARKHQNHVDFRGTILTDMESHRLTRRDSYATLKAAISKIGLSITSTVSMMRSVLSLPEATPWCHYGL